MRSATARPPSGILQPGHRSRVFPREGAGARMKVIEPPNTKMYTCSVPTAKALPANHHVTTTECWAGRSLSVHPFRLTEYASVLPAYSSCINKCASSYCSSQPHQTGRSSIGSLTWDITACSQTPSPGLVFLWWFLVYFGVLVVGSGFQFVLLKHLLQRNHNTIISTLNLQALKREPTYYRT